YAWQFSDAKDWSAQPVFIASDTLVLCLPTGTMRRWTRDSTGQWQEAKTTVNIPVGLFTASAASSDGKTVYLAMQHLRDAVAPDGWKYSEPTMPYEIIALASDSGEVLWKRDLAVGLKKSLHNFTADPINALVAVPGSDKVVAALWDGRVALAWPPAK